MAYVKNYDCSGVKPGLDFEALPAGEYLAHIVESDVKESKSGEAMLIMSWMVTDGDYAGQRVFDSMMLTGKGSDFGKRKLVTIADVLDYPNPNNVEETEDLHGVPCLIEVGFGTGDYKEKNQIKNYKKAPSTAPRSAVAPAAAQNTAPPAASRQAPPQRQTPPPARPTKPAESPFDEPAPEIDNPF